MPETGASREPQDARRKPQGASRRPQAASWMAGGAVLVLALTMVVPFLYMVSTALMGEGDVLRYPGPLVPVSPHLGNFGAALTALPFARFFFNTAIFSVSVVAGQLVTSTTAAYAFSRLRFPGRDRVFMAYLSVLMVPAVVLLIPRFLIINALGWVDSYQGLIVTEIVSVWGIFLLRQFFLTLPRDLEDAARLDGAGEWTIFWRVVLPLSKPALAAVAVFAFVEQLRNFLSPLVAKLTVEMNVVEVGLARLHGLPGTTWPEQMAAAVMAIIPLAIVFFVAQKYWAPCWASVRLGDTSAPS